MNTSCGSHVVSDPASGCESKGYHQNTKSKKKRYISNTSIDLKRLWKCLGLEIQNDPRSACVCVCVCLQERAEPSPPIEVGSLDIPRGGPLNGSTIEPRGVKMERPSYTIRIIRSSGAAIRSSGFGRLRSLGFGDRPRFMSCQCDRVP